MSIALDVNGKRFTKKLPSDMSLWKVMRQFETAERGLNITGRGVPVGTNSGQLYHEAPIVNIMGREYSALEDLNKTLSQCGINSGSIVLRVTFKLSERTLFDALQEISRYLSDVEPEQPKVEEKSEAAAATVIEQPKTETPAEELPKPEAAAPTPTTEQPTPSAPAEPAAGPDLMDIDGTSTPTDHLQPTNVFTAPSSSTPAAARTREDDSVYEPTIAHAQLRQHQLLQRAQNTRLKSDAELAADAAEEARRLAKITSVEIKVRFPDQTSALWTVSPDETGAFVYDAVRGVMAHPDQPFRLILPGPKTVVHEDEKKLIAGYRLKGREMLHLLWEDGVPPAARGMSFLKGSVASKAREVVVPEIPQASGKEEVVVAGPSTAARVEKRNGGASSMDSEAVKKKLGKFLGLKKK